MIVKVQISVYGGSPGKRKALVYDQRRYVEMETEATPDVLGAMAGAAKAYFHATVDSAGRISLGKRAHGQAW